MLNCLRNIVLTVSKSGHSKFEARLGRHDEDFILLGRALYLMMTRPMKIKTQSLSQRLRVGLGINTPRPVSARLRWG